MKYSEIVKQGKEIVIIATENENCDSAIFWYSQGHYYSFCRAFGEMRRGEMTDKRFNDHIKNMEKENAIIYVRGCND